MGQRQPARERHAARGMNALYGLVHIPGQLKLALQEGQQGGVLERSVQDGRGGEPLGDVIEGGLPQPRCGALKVCKAKGCRVGRGWKTTRPFISPP